MMIVLETPEIEMGILKSFRKWSINSPRFPFNTLQFRLEYTLRIMRHSLHLFSCRIQPRQLLSPAVINARETFANDVLQLLNAGEIRVENIWFSMKHTFLFNGFVNKQNWRNLEQKIHMLPYSHPWNSQRQWATVSSIGLIGLFFRRQTITSVSGHSETICGGWKYLVGSWEHLVIHARRFPSTWNG